MSPLKEKRLRLGGFEVAFAAEASQAERIQHSLPYRFLLRPALDRLRGRTNGHHHQHATLNGEPPVARRVNPPITPEAQAIRDRIAGIEWYHTIELPHGVETPGFTDHRHQLPLYGLPKDLRGKRALDVATYDGFWAFEMERRGAEVVAIDIGAWSQFDIPRRQLEEWERSGDPDKPTGKGFAIAHELLGSKVDRKILSVYELSPDKVGTFDLVFLSDLLLHLRDPQRALENVRSVVRPTGCAIIADVYNPRLEHVTDMNLTEFTGFGTYVWWLPSSMTLKAMMRVAGFKRIEEVSRFELAATAEDPIHKIVLKGYPLD